MTCRRVYRLNKGCVELERNVDSFRAKQELQRSAHPILWIYIDFSTVASSTFALRSGLAGDLQASGGAGPILDDGAGQRMANRAGGRQVSRLAAVAAGFALLVLLL